LNDISFQKFLRVTAIVSSLFILVIMNGSFDRNGFGNDWANSTVFCLVRWIYPTTFMALILVSTFGYESKVYKYSP
jgi:hypothetical protein